LRGSLLIMPDGESRGADSAGGKITVRVRFPPYDDVTPVFANHFSVVFMGDEFVVAFYAAIPPILVGPDRDSQLTEIQEQGVEIPAKCVAKVVIPKDRMFEISNALAENVARARSLTATSPEDKTT